MRSIVATSFIALVALAGASSCSSKSDGDAAAAAGGPAAIASTSASGSRLRANILTGGGAREIASFHDSLRNEDCTFQPAEAGHIRCLPAALSAFPSSVFSDAACQVPAATSSATTGSCGSETYALVYRISDGCGPLRAKELRKVQGTGGDRYVNNGTGCVKQSAPVPGQPASVALGDVVAWTDFVEATATLVPGDGITERVLVAADGSRAHAGYRDPKLDVDCSFQIMADGVTRCAPEDRPGAVLYSDGDCSQAVFVDDYRSSGGCSTETINSFVWIEPTADLCSGLRAVYSLNDDRGIERVQQDVYSWQNDYSGASSKPTLACRSSGSTTYGGYNDHQNRRSIAANVTASLPSVPRVGGGSARLVPTFVWPPGPSSVLVPGWHDNERDVDCTFTLASDGKTRCLPVAAKGGVFFNDDACKSTSHVAVPTETSCIGAGRFVREVSATCPATTNVWSLSAEPFDLPSASTVVGPDRCAKVGGVTGAREATLVDPSQFVEGVASVE